MAIPFYETNRALSEYLLFHYDSGHDRVPPGIEPFAARNFPARCVSDCLSSARLASGARGLDLGCAVGRSTFELARHCQEVIGIDYSNRFIRVANQLKQRGSVGFAYAEEGEITRKGRAVVPPDIQRERVRFQTGDASRLPHGLGTFDVLLMANLIDRLARPRRCLAQLPRLVKPHGRLVISSPYTWLREYTDRKNWLGGLVRSGREIRTLDTLKKLLNPHFRLERQLDLPFLLREHIRKYQLGIAQATIWIRK